MAEANVKELAAKIKGLFSPEQLDVLGRETGHMKRVRVVTSSRLVMSVLSALSVGTVGSLADLLRVYRQQHGRKVAYKAFYQRVCHAGFAALMKMVCGELLRVLSARMLKLPAVLERIGITDILIHDGTHLVLPDGVAQTAFHGFSKRGPRTFRLHVTYSAKQNQPVSLELTGNAIGERQKAPQAPSLHKQLILLDRGYSKGAFFGELDACGAFFIIRIPSSFNPWVRRVWMGKAMTYLPKAIRLNALLKCAPYMHAAFETEVMTPHGLFRLVFQPTRKGILRLCTNLDRTVVVDSTIKALYRFRWQIELVFKQWKSHAQLLVTTSRNPAFIEAMIWASFAVLLLQRAFAHHANNSDDDTPISTHIVAMMRHAFFHCFAAIARPHQPGLISAISALLALIRDCAKRSNPLRDRRSGRLAAGFLPLCGLA